MAGLAGAILWQVQTEISVNGWVEHSDEVIVRAKNAEIALLNIRTGLRNYLLSPDPSDKNTLAKAQRQFTDELVEIAALVTDNADQERRLIRIVDLKGEWIRKVD